MSTWMRWDKSQFSADFAGVECPDKFIYPNLKDGSPLVLATDYSGEHHAPEFRVLSYLLTTNRSVDIWDKVRRQIREQHLRDRRRMSFKALGDAMRINALLGFLDAASELNGVLLCVAVEKGLAFPSTGRTNHRHHWTDDTFNKLLEVCVFGATLVDGLRSKGQNVFWITDDDAIVSTDNACDDAVNLMGHLLQKYPDEYPTVALGVASKFDDDLKAEDLVAIPDLAAGAFSEALTAIGKDNLPRSGTGPTETPRFLQTKASLINSWRSDQARPLKHLTLAVRQNGNGKVLLSFGSPFVRTLRADESLHGAPVLSAKWKRALRSYLERSASNK